MLHNDAEESECFNKFFSSIFTHDNGIVPGMGAGTWGAGWATAHPGKNQGGPCPPWKY